MMANYFETMKNITRTHTTLDSVNWNDGYKPRCRHCFVSVDPRSREYRALRICEACYDFEPLIIQKKEILPCKN